MTITTCYDHFSEPRAEVTHASSEASRRDSRARALDHVHADDSGEARVGARPDLAAAAGDRCGQPAWRGLRVTEPRGLHRAVRVALARARRARRSGLAVRGPDHRRHHRRRNPDTLTR